MINEAEQKIFTYTWNLENVSCHWHKKYAVVKSPTFGISDQKESKCHLNFRRRRFKNDKYMEIYLCREDNSSEEIDCELAILSKDGVELKSIKRKNGSHMLRFNDIAEIKEEFNDRSSAYFHDNKLTVRCRIWKSEGELTRAARWFARTRICIRREVFLWNIQNIICNQPEDKFTYHIKSVLDNAGLMSFKLILNSQCGCEDSLSIQLVSENSKSIYFEVHLTLLNYLEKENKGIKKEFFFTEFGEKKIISLPFTLKDFLTSKNMGQLNDGLTFHCYCKFSTGTIFEEIESVVHDCESFEENEPGDEENPTSTSKRVLSENLKSLFQDNILSDIKLETGDETFLAHKSILSARSSVFKAMFEHDMKEKITESVYIEDLDSNTVRRMLQYAYTAETEGLPFESACELYRAADKYQILALRDECSALLKGNISVSNACESLIFADTYQDEDLKSFVQDFIFDNDIMISDKWKLLMETHVKLASDTMYLHIQRKLSDKKFNSINPVLDANIVDTSATSKSSEIAGCFTDNIKIDCLTDVHGPSSESGISSASTRKKQRLTTKKWKPTSNFRDQETAPTSDLNTQASPSKSNSEASTTPSTFTFGAQKTPSTSDVGTPVSSTSKLSTPASSTPNFEAPGTPHSFTFGAIPLTSKLGTPASPTSKLGTSAFPTSKLGTPASPSSKLGTPASPSSKLGTPAFPSSKLGTPAFPSSKLGTPASPTSKLGTPSSSTSKLGTPASSTPNFYAPTIPRASRGFRSATNSS